ncbi:ABC transporter ATP-binding protein [Lacticigenium naphthae]|uniref:ABC transporter ATP-binding protein n=1 Tax=Lacticigenium naphthae TaxID=515351 RepID=UPI0004027740|nr:ATP-binding cassette domain-containing protein [Lacticigenium naphthae]
MSEPLIELKNVGFEVDGTQILQDISFVVNKGEVVTFSGPSGSGKSTLLKLIGTILTPTSGEILYKGTNLKELNPIEYRKEVSYFFQNAALFDETVEDNLSFPAHIREKEFEKERALKLMEQVQIPESYLTKKVKDLSGGEKQRIAFVRNLMYQPDVLLLDEVTSSLDQENREIIGKLINEMIEEEKITVLSITHNQAEIEKASRMIEIRAGKMEEDK